MRKWVRRIGLVLGVAVVTLLATAATLALDVAKARPRPTITVTVGIEAVRVPADATVAQALRRAGVEPRTGVLRSVVSGTVLDPELDPPHIRVDGRLSVPRDFVGPGSLVTVVDGVDVVEAVATREEVVPFPGLPDVERALWRPGADGLDRVTAGTVSGEELSRQVLRAPVPAARVEGKIVALTFDDGPDPTWTPAVLAALDAAAVKATFCVVGRNAAAHPELVAEIVRRGHVLCDHTQDHPEALADQSPELIATQMRDAATNITAAGGPAPRFFRTPYGAEGPAVASEAHAQGMRVLGWSVDPRDWERPPWPEIVTKVVEGVQAGGIVLLHDGGTDRSQTVAALPWIVALLRAQGYTFVQPTT